MEKTKKVGHVGFFWLLIGGEGRVRKGGRKACWVSCDSGKCSSARSKKGQSVHVPEMTS